MQKLVIFIVSSLEVKSEGLVRIFCIEANLSLSYVTTKLNSHWYFDMYFAINKVPKLYKIVDGNSVCQDLSYLLALVIQYQIENVINETFYNDNYQNTNVDGMIIIK